MSVPLLWLRRELTNKAGWQIWEAIGGGDLSAALTYYNTTTGLEFTVAPGVMINGKNEDTDYRTGTEFHLEFAAVQHFSPAFALDLTGFHYQQITGDSGSGAVLGDFKGRVTGLGPVMTATFVVGKTPVVTSLRWIREFNVKHRLEGNIGQLSVTIPLGGP